MTTLETKHPLVQISLQFKTIFILFLGIAVFCINHNAYSQLYNTPGAFTYTVPTYSGPTPGPNESLELRLIVTIVGAGGGGGRGDGAGGGGGGQVLVIDTLVVQEGQAIPLFIGTGGAGGIASNNNGLNGSASSLMGIISAGGSGGRGGNAGFGGASGSGNPGGNGSASGNLLAGGGGAGAAGNGFNGSTINNGNTEGGNGGIGINGFGGGGGGSADRNGNTNNIQGEGRDSGTNGSNDNAANATNGGGGGAGWNRGGRGGHGVVIIDLQARILPVKYTSIKATFNQENRTTEINWTTAKEWENSHFEIERAIGQVKDFENVGTVEGTGFSDEPADYSFSDQKLPLTGGMAYYRLKQIDFNGKFHYSEVLSVRIPSMQVQSGVWRAYPNPTKGHKLNIGLVNLQEYADEPISLRIVSPLAENYIIEGNNIREISDQLSDKLQGSSNGLYIIEVFWGQKREYLKVLKN